MAFLAGGVLDVLMPLAYCFLHVAGCLTFDRDADLDADLDAGPMLDDKVVPCSANFRLVGCQRALREPGLSDKCYD